MTRTLKIAPQAELELEEARLWYEDRQTGLGQEFMRAFERRINALRSFPGITTLIALKTHRAQLRPFAYFVLYTFNEREVAVTAVFHAHRDPRNWSDRVRESTREGLYLFAT